MTRNGVYYLLLSAAVTFLGTIFVSASGTSNTTCISTQLDWYTEWVGETPCATYKRLRQICDLSYEVGPYNASLTSQNGGDSCETSQVKDCCCNPISFGLSNLCFNCLYSDATLTPHGFDALHRTGTTFYQSCYVVTNLTLPTEIQTAVCTDQIDIIPTLYKTQWPDESFWFEYFVGRAIEDKTAYPGKNLSSCSETSSSSATTPAATATTTATAGVSSTKNHDAGAIAGGIVGGVVGGLGIVACVIFALRYLRRRTYSEAGAIQPYLVRQAGIQRRPSVSNVHQLTPLQSHVSEIPEPLVFAPAEVTGSPIYALHRRDTISTKETQPPPYQN